MVRIRCFHCHGPGSIPAQGTKIPQTMQRSQKIIIIIIIINKLKSLIYSNREIVIYIFIIINYKMKYLHVKIFFFSVFRLLS